SADLSFCTSDADEALYLVVMATPSEVQKIMWDQMYYTIWRYPWMIELGGAVPDGLQANPPPPSAGARRWPNGGGWVAPEAIVADSVFVGPYAAVLGGEVSGSARIDGHAVVLNGRISGGASVRGLSVIAGGLTLSDDAVVSTVFQAPGSFERGQSIVGSAQLWGDVELRGANARIERGVFYGMVDQAAVDATSPSQGGDRTEPVVEVTAKGPYVWR
ncbi:MAG: DUF6055 domain-containing protein, partial [Polyangiales bacterium]